MSRGRRRFSSSQVRFEQLESRCLMAADVVISEFLASNSGGLEDGDGDSSDWVELYNTTSGPIDLGGYYLTDDSGELTKWSFPSGATIGANSTLVVFASDKDAAGPAGELHTNFKLSAGGEYLGLVAPDGVSVLHDYAPEFPSQETNISYGLSMSSTELTLVDDQSPMRYLVPTSGAVDSVWRDPAFDDSGWTLATAGLGYENSPGSSTSYASLIDASVPSGVRSAYTRFEFAVADPDAVDSLRLGMIYDDGFVAYLNGVPIASANAPASPAWNSTAGSIFRGDEVVLADYVEFDVSAHADLLSASGNVLAIHALNQSSSSDMLMVPRLVGASSDLVEPLEEGVFATPTPGAANGAVFAGIVADTKFSVDRGFYEAPVTVEITSATPGAMIVYTTDGSAPTVDTQHNITNGVLYTGGLTLSQTTNLRAAAFKQGMIATNVDTQTYFFVADIVQQTYSSALASGLPSWWGSRPADYGLDPDVIGPGDLYRGIYAAQIESSLLAIPSVSLTLDSDDFFGPGGIYSNPTATGVQWERAVSAEVVDPTGEISLQVDAGLRIHGAASRSLSLKNGLRLLFKSEYGDSKLDYPFFGAGVDSFDTIVLRPHFNDGWGWDGALGDPLYTRDQWFRDTQAAMGHESSRGNLMHLYVNGQYWGLYNPSERPDDSWSAETYGGEKDEYDVMVADGVHSGTGDAYQTMLSLAGAVLNGSTDEARYAAYQQLQGNLPNGMNDPAAEDYLDVVNYIDYMILCHYGGNNDWPDRNWYASRRQGEESEGFKFVAWDSEISLALSDRTSLFENNLAQTVGAAEAYGILRNYEEFRLQFADRIHEHLYNGGALYVNPASPTYDPAHPEDNVPAARFAGIAEQVGQAIVAESARWGDQHVSTPRTKNNDWQPSLDYMLDEYFRDRHGIVLAQWRQRDLYPDADAPELLIGGARQHGGTIAAGDLLGFQDPNANQSGTIYYTTDGADPRLVGGAVNAASASVFTGSVALSADTHIKARTLLNGEWSALTEATFVVPSADFDNNGVVNGADFLAWQLGIGAPAATPADGDADLDGQVNAVDLAVWQTQAGESLPPGAASLGESAPEAVVGQPLAFAVLAAPTSDAIPTGQASSTIEASTAASVDYADELELDQLRPKRPSARPASVAVRTTSTPEAVDDAFADWQRERATPRPVGRPVHSPAKLRLGGRDV
ncbi:CotH protein [Posidoniimonas polymericola]|uniref:CotH protein n=1 Tax=Posidoniimonas polymericola TaxID=2528002 RepID=A0A5C5YSU5_9BACT|nr:chitobiase/beta-hexosaminidase C-terminal domain-containing protein [Posidoniimonas polymericola]TWT77840.1 CotH protein [Posidoniimonas polymericola]